MAGHATWAEISLARLRDNFRAIRSFLAPHIAILAIVKADAYGHGAREVARALAAAGAEWFGVSSVAEARELRAAGIERPILLLGGFWPGEEDTVRVERLTPGIFSAEHLRLLEACGRKNGVKLAAHLKVDTGMARLGLALEDLAAFLDQLRACEYVALEGLYTHLASADEETGQTPRQLALFEEALRRVKQAGFAPVWVHAANSAAMVRCPESRGTLVRPGLALYGYQLAASQLQVAPVLSLKSRVVFVRALPVGSTVGYGATHVTRAPARIATVCAGYADGVNRALSNRGRALVRGRFAPIAGRVSMDYTMLDVTQIPEASPGDEVVFIGRQGDLELTAADMAELAGTVPYEILCHIGPRVPRVYREE